MKMKTKLKVVAFFILFIGIATTVFVTTAELHVFIVVDGEVLDLTHPKVENITKVRDTVNIRDLRSLKNADKDLRSNLKEISNSLQNTDYSLVTIYWPSYLAPKKVAGFVNRITN